MTQWKPIETLTDTVWAYVRVMLFDRRVSYAYAPPVSLKEKQP